jgi:hypothetical protein
MLFEKSYDIVLWFLVKIIWKYLENFPHSFFSKIFKLIFLESSAANIENAYFYLIQKCPCFVFSLLFIHWIIFFATKLRFGINPSKPFLSRIKKNYFTETCQIGKPTHPPRKIYFIKFMKKHFSFDVLKFGIF